MAEYLICLKIAPYSRSQIIYNKINITIPHHLMRSLAAASIEILHGACNRTKMLLQGQNIPYGNKIPLWGPQRPL